MLKSNLKKFVKLAALAGLAGIIPVASMAQVDFTILVPGSSFTAINGNANTEIDGVASNAAGTIQYIGDSIGTFDGVARWNGSALTVFGTEAQIEAPTSPASVSFADMTCDAAGTLYICYAGNPSFTERIRRIPSDNIANIANMVTTADATEVTEIAVDETNSRLILGYNDFNNPGGITVSFGEGIGWVALNATDATVNEIASKTELQAALDTVAGGANDLDIQDVAVQSDGTVLATHGFSSGNNSHGTILKVDPLGNSSVLISGEQLINALGGDGSAVDIGQVELQVLNDDKIFVHILFSSNTASFDGRIAVGSPDGTNWVTIVTHTQILADSDLSSLTSPINMDGKHGNIDSNENYYFYDQLNNAIGATAVIKMTGLRSVLTASVDNWNLY